MSVHRSQKTPYSRAAVWEGRFNGGSGSRRGTFSCPRHPQRVSGELQSRELIDCRPYCRPAPLGPSLKNGCRHTHCWRCSGYLGRSADRVRAYNATRNAQKCAPIAKTHHIMQFLLAQGQRTYCSSRCEITYNYTHELPVRRTEARPSALATRAWLAAVLVSQVSAECTVQMPHARPRAGDMHAN